MRSLAGIKTFRVSQETHSHRAHQRKNVNQDLLRQIVTDIVADYIANRRPVAAAELAYYQDLPSLEDAISQAALGAC